MRVLVTGGAGFIGSNLVEHLSAAGSYELVVLDNLSAGQSARRLPPEVEFIHGDFTDGAITANALRGVDAIIHLAALSGVLDSVEDPRPSFEINVAGTFQLLELARRAKVGRIINASTGGALLGKVTPPISESMAPCPLSPYGASKLAAEGYCSAFAGAYNLPCVTLRFSNIYGPRSGHKKSVVAAFIKNVIGRKPLTVFGDGTQKRDFLYVGDLVRGIELALHRDLTGTYQLGAGKPTSLQQLITALRVTTALDFEIRYEPARSSEVHTTWCDISKAARELGYSAPTDLKEGLRQTWQWFTTNENIWESQLELSSSD
jgi:UDP-glucose 4-epimerase